MLSILTINAAIQDVRLFSRSFYRPVNHVTKRLQELAQQIKANNPDLVCLQELFHADFQNRLYSLLITTYPYAAGFAPTGFKLRLGNELIILSKYPVTDKKLYRFKHATLEEKLFTSKGIYIVTVDMPEIGEIQVINFHMTAGGLVQHPEQPQMEKIRSLQIQQLLTTVNPLKSVIMAGDLNAGPEVSIANYEQILSAGFKDAFIEAGGSGITWDPSNPLVANHGEHHLPPQRIDHIFLNNAAIKILKPCKSAVVLNKPSIHIDDADPIPVSDHYGLRVDFRIDRG